MLQQVYVIFLKCGMGCAGISNFCFMPETRKSPVRESIVEQGLFAGALLSFWVADFRRAGKSRPRSTLI
jgi:hypothetical protein